MPERARPSFYHRLDPTLLLDAERYCREDELQKKVFQDLQHVLSARYYRDKVSATTEDAYPASDGLQGTILQYGVDGAAFEDQTADGSVLKQELARAIGRFEPRLSNVQIRKETPPYRPANNQSPEK